MTIREATYDDFDAIWEIFSEVVKKGDTYAFDKNTTKEQSYTLWMNTPRKTFVSEIDGEIVGTYYLKTNQAGGGSHVCNCGYMVSSKHRGLGTASTMCEHSKKVALDLGYLAMQFNFVVATNVGAIKLWRKLGFDVVGTLPKAFKHPTEGYVDALVMYQWLLMDKED